MNQYRGINYMEGFKMTRNNNGWTTLWIGIGIGVTICLGIVLLVNWSS